MTEEELEKLREWSRKVIDALDDAGIRARVELSPPGDRLHLLSSLPMTALPFSPFGTWHPVQDILSDGSRVMERAVGDHKGWWADVHPYRG